MEQPTATSNEATEGELSPDDTAAATAGRTGTSTTLMPPPAAGDGNIEELSAAMAQLPPPSSTAATAGGGAATATVADGTGRQRTAHAFTHAHSATIPFGPQRGSVAFGGPLVLARLFIFGKV